MSSKNSHRHAAEHEGVDRQDFRDQISDALADLRDVLDAYKVAGIAGLVEAAGQSGDVELPSLLCPDVESRVDPVLN